MQHLEVKVKISSPVITESMKLVALLTLAKQLGVNTNGRIEHTHTGRFDSLPHRDYAGANQ